MSYTPLLVIHGGAGTIKPGECDDTAYRKALLAIVSACQPMLTDGVSSAVDIATKAVELLENDPLFNAGYGSVFNKDAEHECDACVAFAHNIAKDEMWIRREPGGPKDPSKGCAGVGGVKTIKNPVYAARAVMDHSNVALMIGEPAASFAAAHGCKEVPNSYFSTERRAQQLKAIKERLGENVMTVNGEFVKTSDSNKDSNKPIEGEEETKRGTVGAVVIDSKGNIAAATSTGGLTNKLPGRVGDTACIGHGTIADQRTGIAISCTGTGEAFMRACATHEMVSYFRHKVGGECDEKSAFEASAVNAIFKEITLWGGDGGLIAVKRMDDGTSAMLTSFNTTGMYRGFARGDGSTPEVAVFGQAEGDVLSIDVFEH